METYQTPVFAGGLLDGSRRRRVHGLLLSHERKGSEIPALCLVKRRVPISKLGTIPRHLMVTVETPLLSPTELPNLKKRYVPLSRTPRLLAWCFPRKNRQKIV